MNASVRRPCDTALALATWPWAIRGRGLGAVDLELPGSKVWLICGKLIYCCVHKSLTILLLIKVHIYMHMPLLCYQEAPPFLEVQGPDLWNGIFSFFINLSLGFLCIFTLFDDVCH